MALLSQSDLEARLGRSLTAEEASAFTLINDANQAYIEKMIGSSVESVSATTRYYDGGVQHLKIDPCTSLTAVVLVDDDQVSTYTYDTTDYTVEPVNRTLKTMLRHRPAAFVTGINNIAVTAKFSIFEDTNVLNIVKNAMLESLVSEIDNSGNIKRESIEGYSVEFAETQTKNALDSIKYLFPEV
jgi:hypothetical protein